jgi:hypothetical protein
VLHWRFIVPLLCLIGAYLAIFDHAANQIGEPFTPWMLFIPVALIMIDWLLRIATCQNNRADEREQKERQRRAADYSGYIALVVILGCILFSEQDHFPSLWIPKTRDDWRAVFCLLIATGVGSRMIGERMGALPPLDEEIE